MAKAAAKKEPATDDNKNAPDEEKIVVEGDEKIVVEGNVVDQPAGVTGIAEGRKIISQTLQTRRVELAESVVNRWYARVDPDVTDEDLERSSFWVHYAKTFRVGDEVDARAVDGSMLFKMVVVAVGPKDVKMKVWLSIELDQIEPDAFIVPSGYQVEWAGDIEKYRVVRENVVVKAGFEQRSAAQNWLGTYLKSIER